MRIAYIFPGQGSQYVEMGKDFYQTFKEAKQVFDEADSLLGYSLSSIMFDGPAEKLNETKYSQVAIYVNSCAILAVMKAYLPEFKPAMCLGLSLGEYTALFASGRISFEEGLQLVAKRAEFMNDACEKKKGKMSAVLGLEQEEVREAIKELEGVWVANCNCPRQTVISGTEEGVQKATESLKEKKARKIIPLVVHGAFHSGLMQEAKERLSPYIDEATIQSSEITFIMNVTGEVTEDHSLIKERLKQQVTDSVLWETGIRTAEELGVDVYLEIGCGKTLTGMNKKIETKAKTISIDKEENLKDLITLNEKGEVLC